MTFNHLRFLAFPLLQAWTVLCLAIGGPMIFAGYQTILVALLIGDQFLGRYEFADEEESRLLRSLAAVSLALHAVVLVQTMHLVGGTDLTNAHGIFLTGYLILQLAGMSAHNAVINSHELVHQPTRLDFFLGQLLAAFAFRSSGAIDHVYGHHRYVGLREDNATARPGESFWRFLPRTIIGIEVFSHGFEKERLARRGLPAWHWQNRHLQGFACAAAICVAAFLTGGAQGFAAFLVSAVLASATMEAGNYIAHYGLVRVPGTRAAEHHSWNNLNTLSTSLLLNLPRHSDHHSRPDADYWKLTLPDRVPQHPFGFMNMTLFAFFPPLFFAVTRRTLQHWLRHLATPQERELYESYRK